MSLKFYWSEFTFFIRRSVPDFFKRGRTGLGVQDTWSFDHYLAKVTAAGLRQLAETTHGVPLFIMDKYELSGIDEEYTDEDWQKLAAACEDWKHWLIDKAEWFEWYVQEDVGMRENMTEEEKIQALDFWELKYKNFKEVVLPDFYEHFDALWD